MKNYLEPKGFSLILVLMALLIILIIVFGIKNRPGQLEESRQIKNKAAIDLEKINNNLKKENQAIQNILEDSK